MTKHNNISLNEVRELLGAISEDNLNRMSKDQQEDLLDTVLNTLKDLAQESFYVFVLLMGPLIVPEGFKDGRHIEIICNALQSLYESINSPKKATERLQIFLPPRAMKSRMGSILFPSWVLGKKPDWNIICVGNSTKFAEDEFGRNVRDLIRSKAYRYIFPGTELRTDAKAVGLFTTTAGGKYLATGAGSSLAGRGAHLVIADDVLSEQTALSKAERTKINKWYVSGLRSRLSPTPQGGELIINCLTKDTEITMSDGHRKSILDVKPGDLVLTVNPETHLFEPKAVTDCWEMGEDEVWEVGLSTGEVVRSNGKHPLLVLEKGFKRVDELTTDDQLMRPFWYETETKPFVTEQQSYLLGFMYGDGWVGIQNRKWKSGRVGQRYYTCWSAGVYEELNQAILSIFEQQFNVKMKMTDGGYYRTDQKHVAKWFESVGFKGNAHTKRFPEWLFKQNEKTREAFYRGFIDADGHTAPNKSVVFGQCNKDLVKDLKRLVSGLGYTSSKILHLTGVSQPPNSPKPITWHQYRIIIGSVKRKVHYAPVKIEYVENTKEKEPVFDLTVEDNHNFIANGVVSSNTRWALDDLSGHTIKVDSAGRRPWKVISVPAILDKPASELLRRPTDPEGLYEEGTSFWPEFQPVGELEERRREFEAEGSPEKWHALYMQNPIPPTGNIIKFEDWKAWKNESPPICSQIVIGMDTAFSTNSKADFSAYVVLGVFSVKEKGFRGEEYWRNHTILLQAGRGRWEFGDLCEKTMELNRQFKPDVIVIEKRASGQSLIQEMRYRGLPLYEFLTDKDKETRLNSVSPMFKAGTVWYPDTDDCREWASIVLDEVCTFPAGANDDLTDALTSALIYLRENMAIVHPDDYVLQSGDSDDDDLGKGLKTYWSSMMGTT